MKLTKKHTLLISVLAILMALCTIVGATIAYLFVDTDPVVNTFSPSNIGLTLIETTGNDYKMIPGETISKDPKVTVTNDVDCYVFVKVDKSNNFDTYMTYKIADGWTQGDGTNIPSNVYYRTVGAADATKAFDVLSDNKVTVPNTVTKDDMNVLYDDDGNVITANKPTLTFTAYAIQTAGFDDAADAWPYALAQSNTLPTT